MARQPIHFLPHLNVEHRRRANLIDSCQANRCCGVESRSIIEAVRPGRAGTIALLAVSLVGCAGDLGDPPVPTDFDTLEAPIIARIRAALDQVADERGSVEARSRR